MATEGQHIQQEQDWYMQARNLVAVRRYTLAEELTRRELAQNPRSAVALTVLSMVLSEQKRYAEAEVAARSAVAVRPLYGEAYYLLAVCLINQRRPTEAGAAIDTALELNASEPKYYALRSQFERAWNYPAQARATAETGLRWDPTHLDCLYQLLKAVQQLAEHTQAEATARTIIGLHPGYWRAHLALGELLLQREAYLGAEEHFRTTLRLEPNCREATTGLSMAWKQRYWLPRQMEKLDGYIITYNEWLSARLGNTGNVIGLLGLAVAISLLCFPLAILYGWAYLRWRLSPVVVQLRGRPFRLFEGLQIPAWRLAASGLGCVAAATLAILLPARLPHIVLVAGLLAFCGCWREIGGKQATTPEHQYLEWFWVGGAAAILFLFWLDDAPAYLRTRFVLFIYAASFCMRIFLLPKIRR